MDLKDSIKEIPELVKLLKQKFMKQSFTEVSLPDGSVIKYEGETPMVGMPVYVLVEGQELPAPDGEYLLEDMTILIVKDGVIVDIKKKEADNAPKQAALPATTTGSSIAGPANGFLDSEEGTQSVKRIVESVIKESIFSSEEKFNKEIELIKSEKEVIKSENESLKKELEKTNETVKQMFELVEKIASMPSENTKIKSKDGYKKAENATLDLEEWRKSIWK